LITVKEEFLGDDKTKRAIKAAGYDVLAMWLALKRYVAEHLTDGFIPDEDIDHLPDAPPKPRKALKALVECGRVGRNGVRGSGLVDQVEHGWMLHNYLKHANSREQEEQRRNQAATRKERWKERRSGTQAERVPERRSQSVPIDDGTGSPARARPHPTPPQPGEEDPPTPLPAKTGPKSRDRMTESLTGGAPKQRADVQELFAEFCELYGFIGAVLGLGTYNTDAETLAECIDARGMADCRLVLKHSPTDGMVSGRDDERRQTHQSIRYIFGNQDAFNRILRAARVDERESSGGSVAGLIERQKSLGSGSAA
jgi:hypothetical protein